MVREDAVRSSKFRKLKARVQLKELKKCRPHLLAGAVWKPGSEP